MAMRLGNVASLRLSNGVFLTKTPTFRISSVSKMMVLSYLPFVLCLCNEESQLRCDSVMAAVAAAAARASPDLTCIHGLPCRYSITLAKIYSSVRYNAIAIVRDELAS